MYYGKNEDKNQYNFPRMEQAVQESSWDEILCVSMS